MISFSLASEVHKTNWRWQLLEHKKTVWQNHAVFQLNNTILWTLAEITPHTSVINLRDDNVRVDVWIIPTKQPFFVAYGCTIFIK